MGFSPERLEQGRNARHAYEVLGVPYTVQADRLGVSKNTVIAWVRDLNIHEARTRSVKFGQYVEAFSRHDIPNHYHMSDNTVAIVSGDEHLPFVHQLFAEAKFALMRYYKKLGYRVVVLFIGDLLNNGAMTRHVRKPTDDSMKQGRDSARGYLQEVSAIADTVILMPGNHDKWFARHSQGTLADDDFYGWLLSGLDMSKVKHLTDTMMFLHTRFDSTPFRLTHSVQYSKDAGKNARLMAVKYQCHMVTHHEHNLAITRDNYNRYWAIANGMGGDNALFGYTNEYDTTMNIMNNSFTVFTPNGLSMWTPYPGLQDWRSVGYDPTALYAYEEQKRGLLDGTVSIKDIIGRVA